MPTANQTINPAPPTDTYAAVTMDKSSATTISTLISAFNQTATSATVNQAITSKAFLAVTMAKSSGITITEIASSFSQAVSIIQNMTLDSDIATVTIAYLGKPFVIYSRDDSLPVVTYERDAAKPLVFYSGSYGLDRFIRHILNVISSSNRELTTSDDLTINSSKVLTSVIMDKTSGITHAPTVPWSHTVA